MGEGDRLAAEKAAARERFRSVRAELSASVKVEASSAIVERVLALPEVAAGRTVMAFWPLPGEVDVRRLLVRLGDEGRTVALAVTGPGRMLTPRRFTGEDSLVAGPFGTREPSPEAALVAPDAIDVVVVPGLAMGRDGTRLGYGGGYYDTFLPTTPAFRLGVVWASALVDSLPATPLDARLDAIVTERGVWRPEAAQRNPSGRDT